jgi:hypothetical protein
LFLKLPFRVVFVQCLDNNVQFSVTGMNAKGKEGICDELLTAIDAKVVAVVEPARAQMTLSQLTE